MTTSESEERELTPNDMATQREREEFYRFPKSLESEERDDGLHDNAIDEWYAEQPVTHSHAHRHFGGLEHHPREDHDPDPDARGVFSVVDGHRHEHTHPPDYVHV